MVNARNLKGIVDFGILGWSRRYLNSDQSIVCFWTSGRQQMQIQLMSYKRLAVNLQHRAQDKISVFSSPRLPRHKPEATQLWPRALSWFGLLIHTNDGWCLVFFHFDSTFVLIVLSFQVVFIKIFINGRLPHYRKNVEQLLPRH